MCEMQETAKQARERLGTDVVMIARADRMLTVLDPIIGVAGKDADVRFELTSSEITCGVRDEGQTMMCMMEASTGCEESSALFDYSIEGDVSVAFSLEHMAAALKAFGDEAVYITQIGARVCLWNDNRRRGFTMLGGQVDVPRDLKMTPDVELQITQDKLKELTSLEKIGETLHIRIDKGRLVFACSSDVETAEIYVPTVYTSDVKSSFGTELVANVVKRIHTREGENITLELVTDAPLRMRFSYMEADYRVYIAPKILGV